MKPTEQWRKTPFAAEWPQGKNVVFFVAKGDPYFGAHSSVLLGTRLEAIFNASTCRAFSSINAASRRLNHPLTVLKESFARGSAVRHSALQIDTALENTTVLVIIESRARSPSYLMALRKPTALQDAKIPRIHWS